MSIFQEILSKFKRGKSQGGGLAVIIVDMQPYFLESIPELVRTQIVLAQLDVLEYCSLMDIPVAYLEFRFRGRTQSEIAEAIQKVPRKKKVIKKWDDGFKGTKLKKFLRGWRVRTLLIAGINADACVRKTAKSAKRHDFKLITAENLVADYRIGRCEKFLKWFRNNGVLAARNF